MRNAGGRLPPSSINTLNGIDDNHRKNMNGYTVTTDKSKIDILQIWDYLSNHSYWAKGCSLQTVQKSIENSLCFGVYTRDNKLVGFARIVTDYATLAGSWMFLFFLRTGARALARC